MKTIRTQTFETNSSSTHSVTIDKMSAKYEKPVRPLVTDNILDARALDDYTVSFGESSYTVCDTKDKKAAIVYNWITGGEAYEAEPETISAAVDLLRTMCGYDAIKPDCTYFYPRGEYDDADYLFRSDFENGNLESFKTFIQNVVLNDDMEISDTDTAN